MNPSNGGGNLPFPPPIPPFPPDPLPKSTNLAPSPLKSVVGDQCFSSSPCADGQANSASPKSLAQIGRRGYLEKEGDLNLEPLATPSQAAAPPAISSLDGAPPTGNSPDIGGNFTAQTAYSAAGGPGKATSQSFDVCNPNRVSPYNKAAGGGAIRRLRNRAHRREISQNRSNPTPNGLGTKQSGGAPLAKQQVSQVEVNKDPKKIPIASQKVNSGFYYSRAIQGGKGSPRQQPSPTPLEAKSKVNCVPTRPTARPVLDVGHKKNSNNSGFDSANRFSVLDIPSSIKFNKLIEVQDDLYPPDHALVDGMELDVNLLNSNGIGDGKSNGIFGISDTQKQVILNCMRDFKFVQAEAVEEWSQGEWDFFADKCMEMGLDPENSILYPEEDTEIEDVEDLDGFESVHAVSQLKKLGSYVDPVLTNSPNRK
ncbi:hypothetical protein L1987_54209 [Smallanthus sonchifolius]|uniref:Uncharacterized protein n=1 Tax=Smallanthus sonchifolius TaxID=185202 RepID=A0ACB9E6L6_9ASTR|nr:hypothetical protein L1987_54209 [Smallanthus sonchifolius]